MQSWAELTIVEHADSGQLTLHRNDCRVLQRNGLILHNPTLDLIEQLDRMCKVCKPEKAE